MTYDLQKILGSSLFLSEEDYKKVLKPSKLDGKKEIVAFARLDFLLLLWQ